MTAAGPFRSVRLGRRDVTVDRRPDGIALLRSPHALGAYSENLTRHLVGWAEVAPGRTFLAQRAGDSWREIAYAAALRQVRSIAQALIERGLSSERPVAILSENGIEHALLALAAMHVGVPYSPISPAYSLVSSDFGKLRHTLGLLTPGLIFAGDGGKFARAIDAAAPADAEIVVIDGASPGRGATRFADLVATPATDAVEAAHGRVGPDTVAKILFTSGSTGMPKGVINTQLMLCANQQMILETLPFLADAPPVLVDWLPWNHTFGGNHNFGMALYNGGSLYIDDGKPVTGGIERTARNLRGVAPTIYFNVPRGYEELVPHLRRDDALRRNFFSRLRMMFYAGAGLPQPVWDALDELAVETCGERILMITGLGSTETAPASLFAHWPNGRAGLVGVPAPGVELKLVPSGDKLEARFRGPNVTPGYWRQDELTRAAFDEEGFYRIGDALRFADPERPGDGLMFDGRLAEDFKLSTGTWVSVGVLRERLIAGGAGLVQDAVIAGHDRDFLTAIIFPRPDACRRLAPNLPELKEVASHPAVLGETRLLLERLAMASTGSASRIVRAVIADAPPSLDAGEITDKGSLNQRAVLRHRAALVEELYAAAPGPRVVDIGRR